MPTRDSDEFNSAAVQLAWLIDGHVSKIIELYGSRAGWLRQVGHPLDDIFLTDEQIGEWRARPLLMRAHVIFRWAGVDYPIFRRGKGGSVVYSTDDREIVIWHALALEMVYEHPEYW